MSCTKLSKELLRNFKQFEGIVSTLRADDRNATDEEFYRLNEIANAITTQIGSWIGVIETVEKAKAKGREVGFQFAHRQARRVTKGRILSMFAFIYRKPSTAFVGLVGLPEAHVKGFLRSAAEAMMGEGVEVNEHAWSWQGK